MKRTMQWILLAFMAFSIPKQITALKRKSYRHGIWQAQYTPKSVWGICTLNNPKFVEKRKRNRTAEGLKAVEVIDLGDGQEIPAGDDFNPDYLASDDPRLGIDFDVKTRRLYECRELDQEGLVNEFKLECHLRGYDHGMFTNGTKECFRAW